MALEVTKIFILLATLSYVLPFVIALKLRTRLIEGYKPILIYVVLDFIFVLLEYIFAVLISNSNPVHHVSSIVISFIILFHYKNLYLNKNIFVFCILLMFVLCFYETIILNKILEPNFLFLTFSNFLISIISFFHLYKLFDSDKIEIQHFQFQYYISMAFFIYNSTSFFMSLFEAKIVSDLNNYFVIVSPIFSSLIIFQNLMITKGIWILRRI